jgi:voltage-gated sodium channel
MECASKIIAEGAGPWLYFIGVEWKWNMFDFAIVMLSMPYVTFLHGSVAFLRLVRLLRLAKLVRKVPQLQMIVYGLVGGLKSIFYIMILLLLVLYMYGVAGVFAFSGSDPWHFRTLDASMITLFSIACLDVSACCAAVLRL